MQEKPAAVHDVHASIAIMSCTLEHVWLSKKTIMKAVMEQNNNVHIAEYQNQGEPGIAKIAQSRQIFLKAFWPYSFLSPK